MMIDNYPFRINNYPLSHIQYLFQMSETAVSLRAANDENCLAITTSENQRKQLQPYPQLFTSTPLLMMNTEKLCTRISTLKVCQWKCVNYVVTITKC